MNLNVVIRDLRNRQVHFIALSFIADSSAGQNMYEPRNEISNNVVCATSKGSDLPAHTRSLIRALASRLNILY